MPTPVVPHPSAKLPVAGEPNVLFLVDLSGYVFRAYHAIAPLSSSKGEPTHAVMGTVSMLQKVVNERRPHMLAVAMDSRGKSVRKEIDARYKATRPPPPEDLSQQMERCEQIVRAYKIPIFREDGLEADDLIASVVDRAVEAGLRVVIVSADKDLMQLVRDEDDRVLLWDSMRDRVYGPAEVRERYGVRPSQMRDFLALTGDTSDNVPGVPGVGPKTASELLTKFGSLDGIYQRIGEVPRAGVRDKLQKNEADARVSLRLVSLFRETPLAFDLEQLVYGGWDEDEVRRLFVELELHRLLDTERLRARDRAGADDAGRPARGAAKASTAPAARLARATAAVLELQALEHIAEEARARGVIAIETETTHPDAMRGVLIGLALATTPGQGWYLPLGHRYLGCPQQVPWDDARRRLADVLGDPGVRKVAHDLKREEIVLRQHGAELRGPTFDSQLAAYLLDPESPHGINELARRELDVHLPLYDEVTSKQRGRQLPFDEVAVDRATEYAAARADVALSLAERLEPRLSSEGLGGLMRDVELPLERVLARMETHGVLVDVAHLEALGARMEGDLRALERQAKEVAGREFSVRSRDQLEALLFDELALPVVKRTPKGGRSTDAEVLEELADKHPLPRLILEYRELDKLKGTYVDALPRAVNPKTGRIHTCFSQAVAATGRLSSNDPNLQNIPIRTEVGREIRAAFVAPPGMVILSADYSQIELRVLAHLSGDPELVAAFSGAGEDVHTHTASLVFGVPREAVTSDQRRAAKTINFGVIYGMGDSALGKQLGVPRAEASRFIEAYFTRYAGVARFMERTVAAARQGEAVRTLLGRRRFLPNLRSANRGLRFEAERVAKNTPIQGTAADILKLAMVQLGAAELPPGTTMVLTVHDELVFEVPEASVVDATRRIREVMESALKLEVPLVVEVGAGKNWRDAH